MPLCEKVRQVLQQQTSAPLSGQFTRVNISQTCRTYHFNTLQAQTFPLRLQPLEHSCGNLRAVWVFVWVPRTQQVLERFLPLFLRQLPERDQLVQGVFLGPLPRLFHRNLPSGLR